MSVNLSIKDVPDAVYERLRTRARENHRSLQGELLAILEETLAQRRLTIEEAYDHVRMLGLKTGDESTAIVRKDRDAG